MKRLIILLWISGLVLMLAGCGGGGGGDDTEIQNAIAAKIDSFRAAVEAYVVDGMLAFLDENDFILTISEDGSTPYDKEYAVLQAELEEDEAKQLHWRGSTPNGHGYSLTMELGTITYSNLSASGGVATVPFTIKEKADDPPIPETITDTGGMVCEMVNLQGQWRCRRMTINYGGMGAIPLSSQAAALGTKGGEGTATTGSFSFGQFDLEK